MFNEHGIFKLYSDQQIILLIGEGEWNLEASTHCINSLNSIINDFNTTEFAAIFDTSKVTGITPESFEAWYNAIQHWSAKAATRIDNPSSPSYQIFLSGMDDYFKSIIPFKYSDSIESAIQWLNTLGYKGFDNGLDNITQITNLYL